MVNMNIFPELLRCSQDLDILNFQKMNTTTIQNKNFIEIKNGCYIMTSQGDLELYISEKLYRNPIASHSVVLSSEFKSGIRNVDKELVKELIEIQLDTEIFLNYSEHIETSYECKEIAQ